MQPFIGSLKAAVDGEGNPEPVAVNVVAGILGITSSELIREYELFLAREEKGGDDETMSEEDYRFIEYEALVNEGGSDKSAFSCRRVPLERYSNSIEEYFEGITLVRKLQETRAFIGFSRVEPIDSPKASETLRELTRRPVSWAPAVKVFGEGIFFQFKSDKLREWAGGDAVASRVRQLTRSYNIAADRWKRERAEINPEYVLIHTFAHMIINRLSFDCGYGSSSIRERVYCDFSLETDSPHDMAGVLIYTASGDSEGSLGGLVRMGEPGRLEGVLWRALEDALWCSSDPVCSQSHGQGPDSCNLAACHNCALLPETCCENGNRILDRIVVVGDGENCPGYFSMR